MTQGLLHLHNFMRWVVLLFALLTLIRSFSGMNSGKPFTAGSRRIALFFMTSFDIQLLLGLALYFIGPWGMKNIQNQGMANVMKDGTSRFFAIEHSMGMLIALVLVHIGYSATKKNISDAAKFKKLFWFTLIALVIVLITIPWPFRDGLGRPWFPGM